MLILVQMDSRIGIRLRPESVSAPDVSALATLTKPLLDENLISVDMTASWDWKTNVSISQNARYETGTVAGMQWPVNVHDGALARSSTSSTASGALSMEL